MKAQLESYEKGAEELEKAIAEEAPGDNRAWLEKVVEDVKRDIQRASNMIQDGAKDRDVNKVFNRLDTVFNRVK